MAAELLIAGDVRSWEKVDDPREVAKEHGLRLQIQCFRDPHTAEVVPYSQFSCREGNQILPVTKTGRIILVSQYKQGVDAIALEVPGGVGKPGETPEQISRRELEEETGFVAGQIILLQRPFIHTRKSPDQVNLLVAKDCVPEGKRNLDKTEKIDVYSYDPSDVWQFVRGGAIKDITTITVLFLAAMFGHIPPPPVFPTE